MAVSLSYIPSISRLSHGDKRCNHAPTKPLVVHMGLHRSRPGACPRTLVVTYATQGSRKSEENVPSWAKPDSDEPPPWAREEGRDSSSGSSGGGIEIPFFVYLLASAITAIAAIGSVFEYVNKKPVFGILSSDSVFYAPLLGFFAITGIPTSAFLWFKSVQTANKEAEEQDRKDGFL